MQKPDSPLTTVLRLAIAGALVLAFLALSGCAHTFDLSVTGTAFKADPYTIAAGTGKEVGFLADGEAVAFQAGDAFGFASLELPDRVVITSIKAVVLDNSPAGYIKVSLIRGPVNTTDASSPPRVIAAAATTPEDASPDFREISAVADAAVAKVDNKKYGYFLKADFMRSTGDGAMLKLRGCIIKMKW